MPSEPFTRPSNMSMLPAQSSIIMLGFKERRELKHAVDCGLFGIFIVLEQFLCHLSFARRMQASILSVLKTS